MTIEVEGEPSEPRGHVLIIAGAVTITTGICRGALLTVQQLIAAFGSVAHAPPDERSLLLSDGISKAMIHGLGCGGAFLVAGFALVGVGIWRSRRG